MMKLTFGKTVHWTQRTEAEATEELEADSIETWEGDSTGTLKSALAATTCFEAILEEALATKVLVEEESSKAPTLEEEEVILRNSFTNINI